MTSTPRHRIRRSTIIPILLLVYLAVMAYIGWPEYASGRSSALYYFGIIGATLLVITLLHFSLKRREALREKREAEDALNMRRMKDDTGEVPAQTDNSPKGPTVSDRPEQTSCDDSRKDAD